MTRVVAPFEVRSEIQDFYARQVQAMDNGRYDEFAETFAEECEFTPIKHQSTAYGRQAIVDKLSDFAKTMFGSGQQRRHWMSMSIVDEVEPNTYEVVSYAIVTNTKAGEPPIVHWAGDIADRLVRGDDGFKVIRREVRSDSIA